MSQDLEDIQMLSESKGLPRSGNADSESFQCSEAS